MAKKLKTKSAVTGEYTKAKGADPKTTYVSDDYPTRILKRMVQIIEDESLSPVIADEKLYALAKSVKKRMGWK